MQIQGDQSCTDSECLRFMQLQEENLVSQEVSGKLATDLVNCSFIIQWAFVLPCFQMYFKAAFQTKQLSRQASIPWNPVYVKTRQPEMPYFWHLCTVDRLEMVLDSVQIQD